jgi:hypothetical protein
VPYRDPEPDDPHMLVGVALPGGEAQVREMAAAFAEEFARLGWSAPRILALFRSPFYAGAHAALTTLGAPAVARLVEESVGVWGRCRVVTTGSESAPEEPEESGLVRAGGRLRVLRRS